MNTSPRVMNPDGLNDYRIMPEAASAFYPKSSEKTAVIGRFRLLEEEESTRTAEKE